MRTLMKLLAMLAIAALVWSRLAELQAAPSGKRTNAMNMQLTSSAFASAQRLPKEFSADGKNDSPPLQWTQPPAGTKSLALICDDPDAPGGTWVHWLIYDLPANSEHLAQGCPLLKDLPDGAKQGQNSFGKIGYGGPSPPPGKPHRYFFKLFALDSTLNLGAGADVKKLEAAMQGHILGRSQLMGQYGR